MKPVVRWSPKLKPGKQPSKDDITECKELVPLDRLACTVAIGGLILIGMTSAILAISGAHPKKSVARKLDAAELVVQNMQLDGVAVESKPANPDLPERSTSGYPSSIPTQGVVVTGIPARLYQTPPLSTKPVLTRFGTETDATRRPQRQLSRSAQYSKKDWAKAFVRYLEVSRDRLRAILRQRRSKYSQSKE